MSVRKSDLANAEERAATIAGLRELADWLEERPDVPMHQSAYYGRPTIWLSGNWFEGEPIATSPKRLAKAMGKADKYAAGGTFQLSRTFSGDISYTFSFEREAVCKPKAVGTRPVTEKVCSDEQRAAELQAELDKLHEDVVVRHEDVIEYDCQPVLR